MELWLLNAMGMIGFWWQGAEWQKSQSSNQNSRTPRDLQHCLVDHAFPRTKIVREFIKVLLYLYKQKALRLMNRSLASVIKLKSHSLSSNSQTWASSPTESLGPWRKSLLHCQKFTLSEMYFPPHLLQKYLWLFTRVTMAWGRRNNQTLQGLWDSGSKLAVIPGSLKCHCGPPVSLEV